VRRGEVVGLLVPTAPARPRPLHDRRAAAAQHRRVCSRATTSRRAHVRRAAPRPRYLAQEASIFPAPERARQRHGGAGDHEAARAERDARLGALLEELNLTHLADRLATRLSGGERRASRSRARWRASRRTCCSTSRSSAIIRSRVGDPGHHRPPARPRSGRAHHRSQRARDVAITIALHSTKVGSCLGHGEQLGERTGSAQDLPGRAVHPLTDGDEWKSSIR